MSDRSLVSRFFPPNNAPRPARGPSAVSDGGLGEVERRVGTNASLSLPTGEALLLDAATSMVSACRGASGSSEDRAESTSVASEGATESSVSELIRGDDSVR